MDKAVVVIFHGLGDEVPQALYDSHAIEPVYKIHKCTILPFQMNKMIINSILI